jgi:hypothetical protein
MNLVDQKKSLVRFRVRWLRAKLDRDEIEYLLGRTLLTFGYFFCLGLLILMVIYR